VISKIASDLSSKLKKLQKCNTSSKKLIKKVLNPDKILSNLNNKSLSEYNKFKVCNKCGKLFKTIKELAAHSIGHKYEEFKISNLISSTVIQEKLTKKTKSFKKQSFKCSKCDKAFFTIRNLMIHLRMHNGKMKYSCEKCGKKFAFARSLSNHLRMHARVKHI
jgi:KRAB and SCAN domains-containing zinc finger protein